jgi:hypothetical protein
MAEASLRIGRPVRGRRREKGINHAPEARSIKLLFPHKAVSACLQTLNAELFLMMRTERNDPGVWNNLLDTFRGLDAIHHRHYNIYQNNVGRVRLGQLHGVLTVVRFSHYGPVWVRLDDLTKDPAESLAIIRNDKAQGSDRFRFVGLTPVFIHRCVWWHIHSRSAKDVVQITGCRLEFDVLFVCHAVNERGLAPH